MAEIEKKPLKITETILRDAHQSLIATRMTTEQMLPIVDKMDKVGYHAVECWGGATFDASLRFLKEDPWERLRKLRDGFKNTKLQMLFRGQNILGYNHYADDVVEYFVQKSIANGIDIIRIFDCLNDIRNLETAVNAANKENGHAQVALCYTLGDAYTLDYWKDMAKKIEDMGAKSLCIKDMDNESVVRRGTYLYATVSGFSSGRVKGSINSILVEDELVKVSLSIYDTDGLEGLYVPISQFRETSKDVASSAMSGSMNMNTSGYGNSLAQWGMQAVNNAYQKTSNAISKAIKKNKVKLKYGTFVYLVNGRENRN